MLFGSIERSAVSAGVTVLGRLAPGFAGGIHASSFAARNVDNERISVDIGALRTR
jgi:hypothetical protein